MGRTHIRATASGAVIFALAFTISLRAQPQSVREVEDRLMNQADQNIEKYRKGDAAIRFVTDDGKPLRGAIAEVVQKSHDFLLGCIIFDLIWDENPYRQELFKERFKNLFNFAVFPFYWPSYENHQGMPRWANMIPVLEWCKLNGINTKGHPLVWACQSGVPPWLSGYSVQETEELLKSRVVNIVRGFRGRIDIWDVVNEPINVKTWKHKIAKIDDENDWGVEDSIPEIADYVTEALKWAHAANPSATLIVNEFMTLAREKERMRFNALLKELNDRKAPISGVGIQAHEPREEWFQPEQVWKTFDLFFAYGHPIHITELHPQSSGKPITGGWRSGTWTREAQAEFAGQFVRLCFGHPAIASMNWWGLSDRNSWLPGGGLIDEEYRPKPIYDVLDRLFNKEWRTRASVPLDGTGSLSFRGFFGTYEIRLTTKEGNLYVYPIHVRREEQNSWTFRVGD